MTSSTGAPAVNRTFKLGVVAALLAGCSTLNVDLPAVTEAPTGQHDTGRVIWHDLLTTTPEESRRFYGELFGWTFEKPGISLGFGGGDAYMLIRHEGRLIGGSLTMLAASLGTPWEVNTRGAILLMMGAKWPIIPTLSAERKSRFSMAAPSL